MLCHLANNYATIIGAKFTKYYHYFIGLCGKARITEVGGPGYLLPSVMRDKIYNVTDLAKLSEVENAFVIGAGAGPFPFIGVNSEVSLLRARKILIFKYFSGNC